MDNERSTESMDRASRKAGELALEFMGQFVRERIELAVLLGWQRPEGGSELWFRADHGGVSVVELWPLMMQDVDRLLDFVRPRSCAGGNEEAAEVFSAPECPFKYCDQAPPHADCKPLCRHFDNEAN